MSKTFSYKSDEYGRQTQRFVIPLYIKDNLENYNYSSTATMVHYNEHHYILFSAHALDNDISIDDIYTFFADGRLERITEYSIGDIIFKENDIVIIDHFNNRYDGKNYFNLNKTCLIGFDKNHFAWTGFPNSKVKAKIIHNSKSEETLKDEYIHLHKDKMYFKNAKYLTISSKILSYNKDYIKGKYNRKNSSLKYSGAVSMGAHPKGMSGGAMYFFSKNRKLKKNLDDTFRFAGIGIEYKNDNTIIGVSRDKVIELLDIFNKDNPVKFNLQEPIK